MPNCCRLSKRLIILIVFLATAAPALAQQFPCFEGAGCPELVNPDPDEYYSVQCANDVIWVWVTIPNFIPLTFAPFY